MAGFPLMAFGAGLGQWAEARQRQQEAQARNMMLQLTLSKYRQEQQDRADKLAGARAEMDFPAPGGSAIGPVNPLGAVTPSSPFGSGLPAASSMGPSELAPGFARGQPSDPGLQQLAQIAPALRQPAAPWSGTMTDAAPDAMASLAASGAPGTAPGWAPGGPVGSMNAAGVQDAEMPTVPPRSGDRSFGAPQQTAQATPSQAAPSPAAAPAGGGAPQDLQKLLDAVPKPDLRDQTNQQAIKDRVKKAYPVLPPTQQLEIFKHERDNAKLAEADRAKLAMKDYDTRLQAALETWKEQNTRAGRALEGGDLIVVDGKLVRQKGGTAAPVMAGGQPVAGATRLPSPSETEAASTNIKITGPDGKDIFEGAAHKAPGAQARQTSWIDDRTQERIVAPEGSEITIKGQGDPGKQAATMLIRLTGAANEAKLQISNIARASSGSTTSWFQGIQSETGKDLSAGVRRTLGNYITPQEEQVMSVLGRGIGRSLATLETAGAATGLVALQQSMQGNMPAKGDTKLVALMKLAEMRQIAEQGIESAIAAPAVGSKQKALLRSVQKALHEAVPYTVADVIDLIQKPGKDTYQSFAAKLGLGKPKGSADPGAAPAGAAAGPALPPPQPGDLRKGYIFRGGDAADPKSWTKAPEGAAPTEAR